MASELDSLHGWVRPYELLKHAVVVLGKHLGAPLKHAIIMSGPALPLEVRLSEHSEHVDSLRPTGPTGPIEDGAQCTRRIFVEPDDTRADDSVRVRMVDISADRGATEVRTIPWNGDPDRATTEVITAIRELAGLDAA